jgi:hypothetical protein
MAATFFENKFKKHDQLSSTHVKSQYNPVDGLSPNSHLTMVDNNETLNFLTVGKMQLC